MYIYICIYIYIYNIRVVNIFCRYTHLNNETVLVLTIQFIISQLGLNNFTIC